MFRLTEYPSLCTTCGSRDTCTYPKSPGRPVLQCEEFSGVAASSPRALYEEVFDPAPVVLPRGRYPRSEEALGLCSNCENRAGCTFPKPQGGVWHCEEYV